LTLSLLAYPSKGKAILTFFLEAVYNKSLLSIWCYLPSDKNKASFFKLSKAPTGDQENLYPKGLSQKAGEGRPPQNDSYSRILDPFKAHSSTTFIVAIWSIPGSTPTSLIKVSPALMTYSFNAAISGCI